MFTPGYYITAELRVKDPEQIELASIKLTELSHKTLQEPGCSIFVVHHDRATPTRFVLWERFTCEEALKEHFAASHTKDYVALDLTEVVQYFQTNLADAQ